MLERFVYEIPEISEFPEFTRALVKLNTESRTAFSGMWEYLS